MTDFPIAKARLERNLSHGGFDVHVMSRRTPAGVDIIGPLSPPTYTHVPTGMYHPPEPAFTLQYESAQAMLDALWEAGIRPSSGMEKKDDAKVDLAVKLMQNHLADLRRMAFGQEVIKTADQPATGPAIQF